MTMEHKTRGSVRVRAVRSASVPAGRLCRNPLGRIGQLLGAITAMPKKPATLGTSSRPRPASVCHLGAVGVASIQQ